MKPKLFLLIIFCSLTGLFASAKTISTNDGVEAANKSDIAGGVFHSETKKPISNVVVTAYLSSKKEKVAVTDGNGNYTFDDLRPGTYKFIFEKDGYKKVMRDKVVIKSDEAFQLNVELNEYSPFTFTPNPSNIFDFE